MKKLVIALAAAAALTVSGPRGRYGRQGSAAGWLRLPTRRPGLAAMWAAAADTVCSTSRHSRLTSAGLPINRSVDQGGRGWIGTLQAGCDYQFPIGANQFVVGAFGDYNFSNMRGDFTGDGGHVGLVSNTEKVDWYWAIGGRIGWLVNPQTLTYFSGGYTEAHRTGFGSYLNVVNVPIGVGLSGRHEQGLVSRFWYRTHGWMDSGPDLEDRVPVLRIRPPR